MSDNLAKVKELRELTGAGIQDCKTALSENNYDIEKSIEYLRKKGITKAAKKSSRDAAEGLAVIAFTNSKACILEVNSETDFVAKNKEFINFCSEISNLFKGLITVYCIFCMTLTLRYRYFAFC